MQCSIIQPENTLFPNPMAVPLHPASVISRLPMHGSHQQTFTPLEDQPMPPAHFLLLSAPAPSLPEHIRHRRCSPRLLTEHEKHTAFEHALQVLIYVSKPYPSSIMASSSLKPTPQSSQVVGRFTISTGGAEGATRADGVEEMW